jgi:hypothetical protein
VHKKAKAAPDKSDTALFSSSVAPAVPARPPERGGKRGLPLELSFRVRPESPAAGAEAALPAAGKRPEP